MAKLPPPIPAKGIKRNETRRPGGEHLEEDEIDLLRKAARSHGRHGDRDAAMILIAYRHALRVSELVNLQWDHINLTVGRIYCQRLKGSISGEHELQGDEIRALKKLGPDRRGFVFKSELGGPVSASGFQKIIARAGIEAGLRVLIHPHMLRHSCGYKMINDGVDIRKIQVWMGHANLQNTAAYTALDRKALKGLWKSRPEP